MRNIIIAAMALAPIAAHAQTGPASAYFGNSLLCKSQSSGGVCDLWLDASGKYAVFYDTGKKAYIKGIEGPFENEGRQGTYTATAIGNATEICLTPEIDTPPRPRGNSPSLFHDQGCVTLPNHPAGQLWDFTYQGETYTMGLIKGR